MVTEFKARLNRPEGSEFNTDTQEWEVVKEEMVSADQADAAIAKAVKKALAKTDDSETDTDEVETEREIPEGDEETSR